MTGKEGEEKGRDREIWKDTDGKRGKQYREEGERGGGGRLRERQT